MVDVSQDQGQTKPQSRNKTKMRALELNELVQRQSPKALGSMHIGLVDKRKNTMEPVIFDFGTAKYRVINPVDKKWLLDIWAGYRRIGKEDKFLEMVGTLRGFEVLLDQYAIHQSRQQQHQQRQKDKNKQPKQQSLVEKATPRAQQSLDQLRRKYPQAADDSEAMLYAMLDAQKQSQQVANKIDQETDKIERNVKQDIDKKITGLTNKQIGAAAINQIKASNDEQQQIINQILKIDQAQQQDLDALKSAEPTGARAGMPPPAEPASAEPMPASTAALPMPVPPPMAPPAPAVTTPAPAVEPVDFGEPAPEEPEQAITKLSPPPRPIPNLPPQGDNVVPFKRPGKQGKLPVPKVGSANDTDGGGAGGFQRIAEMKKIERRLTVSLRNWTKKGLL